MVRTRSWAWEMQTVKSSTRMHQTVLLCTCLRYFLSCYDNGRDRLLSNAFTMNCSGFKNTYGKHDEVGLQENILSQTWLSYIKTVRTFDSFLVNHIFFGTIEFSLHRNSTHWRHHTETISHTVVLSGALCTWKFMFLLHCIPKCGFCLVKFWCEPFVIDHL